jgi:glucose-1-phosphate cytidylyltransferase
MNRLDPADIPVVILAGGLGTRLREETERLPKPLVEVGEKPILWHIMKLYSHHGFRRFVICLGYKSWLIKQFFLHYREQVCDFTLELGGDHAPQFENANGDENWEITFAETGLMTGTGGRLWKVRDYIDADTFMFTYGDGLGSIDIRALLAHHYDEGRIGTVTGVHPASRYGEMRVREGRALEFAEKPSLVDGWVSGGFFVFQREFFDYMTADPELFFEHAPMQHLTRDGQLTVYQHPGFWMGMDTYRELKELNDLWASGAAPWKQWSDDAPGKSGRRRRFAVA